MEARRAYISLIYAGVDISRDIHSFLLDFSFTDNGHGKSDDLQITLEDKDGLWRGPWFPSKGAKIKAAIVTKNFSGDGQSITLPCGTFSIDEIDVSGSPGTCQIKGVSALVSSDIRREKKTRAWENISLSAIANDIAKHGGMKLFWEVASDPLYERRDQNEESDMEFLKRMCEDAGVCLKIANEKIIIFDEADYESKAAVCTIASDSSLLSWSFTSQAEATYRACRVKWHDAVTKTDIDYTYEPPNAPKVGHTLMVNERVENIAEAITLAKKKLRLQNKNEVTGDISVLGNVNLSAGLNVEISGFGVFDAKYAIDTASHSYSQGSGYVTRLSLHRVLEGY
ncbi:contractile injection system protein, VgrG/Pvc8 family [Aminobacterium sp. MB27-C1]|uniref:phage late control D family protein n=1 Tax=Aminobacterium sp. MB27-C1 TaxID=3070661 RepID=UPI0027DC11AD|nr:contractile injection system protein, VgrG/Pvc8 family [Aminobacterium sp. MB27-C1]WMI72134.1 contractile injection system protein, VgrG/Pvc8 family [Aminobacterium sp. MB27-C1]